MGWHPWPLFGTGRGGDGGRGTAGGVKSPQAFPVRKHILLVSGSVVGLLFVAVGYASPLTKTPHKQPFPLCEGWGNLSLHTHAHTHFLAAGSAFQDLPFVAEALGQGPDSRAAELSLHPQPCWELVLRSVPRPTPPRACLLSHFLLSAAAGEKRCCEHGLLGLWFPGRRHTHDSGFSLVPLLPARDGPHGDRLQHRPGLAPGAGGRIRQGREWLTWPCPMGLSPRAPLLCLAGE